MADAVGSSPPGPWGGRRLMRVSQVAVRNGTGMAVRWSALAPLTKGLMCLGRTLGTLTA